MGESRGSPEPMACLSVASPKGEDVLHLVVVLDGCVEELRVFGVVLKKKYNVVSCEKAIFNWLKTRGT